MRAMSTPSSAPVSVTNSGGRGAISCLLESIAGGGHSTSDPGEITRRTEHFRVARRRNALSAQHETVRERIAVVDDDRVVAGLARPSRDAREGRGAVADLREALGPAIEHRADQAFVDEVDARR